MKARLRVVLLTYNHARFIRQAVDSVLAQWTTFPFEIVIVDDASTDGTRQIVEEYAAAFPEKIRLSCAVRNGEALRLWTEAITNAEAELIALIEGDDFWQSPLKLDKQAAFMDAHLELRMSFHNLDVLYEDGSRPPHRMYVNGPKEPGNRFQVSDVPPALDLEDMTVGFLITGCAPMFRREPPIHFPEWFYDAVLTDWPLYVFLAESGGIGFLDEVLGTYRVHANGVWSSNLSIDGSVATTRKMLELYKRLDDYTGRRFHRSIAAAVAPMECRLFERAVRDRNPAAAFGAIAWAVRNRKLRLFLGWLRARIRRRI